MTQLTKEILERFKSQASRDPGLRVFIYPHEWEELCDLAIEGLGNTVDKQLREFLEKQAREDDSKGPFSYRYRFVGHPETGTGTYIIKDSDGHVIAHAYSKENADTVTRLLNNDREEIERARQGMVAWKDAAELKDKMILQLKDVLRELVTLKDMKDRNDGWRDGATFGNDEYHAYKERQPKAWAVAREALVKLAPAGYACQCPPAAGPAQGETWLGIDEKKYLVERVDRAPKGEVPGAYTVTVAPGSLGARRILNFPGYLLKEKLHV